MKYETKSEEIQALLKQLRKSACPPLSCKKCTLNGNCKNQAASEAADLIEEMMRYDLQILRE